MIYPSKPFLNKRKFFLKNIQVFFREDLLDQKFFRETHKNRTEWARKKKHLYFLDNKGLKNERSQS